jgi:hypothetical protein
MSEPQLAIPLISTCIGLLVLVLLLLWRIQARLARIESQIMSASTRGAARDSAPSAAETSAGGAFETFLSEDPARRAMSKSEQFAAYRDWRQQNGLNWSNS